MSEPEHCPNCPDQGWYAEEQSRPRYTQNENGEHVYCGEEVKWEQVQCESCWTNPNSVFNANAQQPGRRG